jgi:hypothetical protein
VEDHPDTGNALTGIRIPGWSQLLVLAAKCWELTGLGYQGVDFVLDGDKGPLLLEINARPGLNIQIANHAGLLPRLRCVEQHLQGFELPEERVRFAERHFGSEHSIPAFGGDEPLAVPSALAAKSLVSHP